jgi:hypothetical protein
MHMVVKDTFEEVGLIAGGDAGDNMYRPGYYLLFPVCLATAEFFRRFVEQPATEYQRQLVKDKVRGVDDWVIDRVDSCISWVDRKVRSSAATQSAEAVEPDKEASATASVGGCEAKTIAV